MSHNEVRSSGDLGIYDEYVVSHEINSQQVPWVSCIRDTLLIKQEKNI